MLIAAATWDAGFALLDGDMLDGALDLALKVGADKPRRGIVFGPTNVAMHTVAVEAEAGETSEALRLADGVDITTIRRARPSYAAEVRAFATAAGLLDR